MRKEGGEDLLSNRLLAGGRGLGDPGFNPDLWGKKMYPFKE